MPLETLSGTVERITYYSEETGYSVIRLAPTSPMTFWNAAADEGNLVTVVGNLPDLTPGESVELEGAWLTHARHGRQFKVENVKRVMPATVEGMKRYLGSGLIKGIGPKTAARIVDAFGADTLDVLDRQPERLYEVGGIGQHRAHLIMRAWVEQQHIKEVMLFLQGHGISTTLAVKIYKTYGDEAVEQVTEDPYRLARDIYGIGFKTADKIARALGLPADHPRRLESGVVYALDQALEDGHCYLPETVLAETAANLLEVSPEQVVEAVERARLADLVRIEDLPTEEGATRSVYLPAFWYAEAGTARLLRRMLETPQSHLEELEHADPQELVRKATIESGVDLSKTQQEALKAAITAKVSVLTGGPGTGKTTALRALIALLQSKKISFALASPTGRAAKRLGEATGQPAKTIHRLLGFSPSQRGFTYNEENPLPYQMVIIDETSMLDTQLAYALVRAVDPRAHLLLVGDVDQLPSVGAGDVLRDLIRSEIAPVTRLNAIFRQSAQSTIISNAHRVNHGDMPDFPEKVEDFFLFNVSDDVERVADLVVEVTSERIPRRFGLHPLDDIQVIVPMNRGPVGVIALNQRLQETLNPPGRAIDRVLNGRMYRAGDKVMQTRNNYDKEVFNGDVGRIQQMDITDQAMTVAYDDRFVSYDFSEVSELAHAYAISVHRSQGSEYPVVVVPMVTQHYMLLQRNLLYTAITRAKRMVVLVGSKKAIAIAVKNDKVSQRYTALALRLVGTL
jgi:exodeoxyribonuclease V alpha subunit